MVYLHCDDNAVTYNKKNYLLRAQERLGLHIFAEYKPVAEKPEYILNIEPYGSRGILLGTKWTGLWEIDVIFDRRELSATNYAHCDTVFQAVSFIPRCVEGFKDKVQVLFQACDPDIHKKHCEPVVDFVTSGSLGNPYHNKRGHCFEVLKKAGFTYEDAGKGKPPLEYAKAISRARVQFIRSADTVLQDGEIAQRFFECLAIGPVLTNRVDDLKLTGLVEDVHYMAYGDDGEMVAKMRLLVDDGGLRNSIASSGVKEALADHTYENRLRTILNTIERDCGHAIS